MNAAQERIQSLDVLRGLAVLGILAVNAPLFAAPVYVAMNPSLEPLATDASNVWAWFVPHVFFEFKFITLFSMLFGASVFLVGGERSDKERGKTLRRRLFWLLIIGLLHATLIWWGDILVTYAVCGFLIMFARSWRARTLMIVGIVLYLISLVIGVLGNYALINYAPPETMQQMRTEMFSPSVETMSTYIAAMQGDLATATGRNATTWLEFVGYAVIGLLPRTVGVMMIGMALFKFGFLSGRSRTPVYTIFIVLGAAALGLVAWQAWVNYQMGFSFEQMIGVGTAANTILSPFITLFYASTLILFVKFGALKWLTEALAPVGRMAFTNYLTQSIIMTTIFYGGRGFGLFGELSRESVILIVPAIWVLQIIWSRLWLSRFEMGPLEWLWRRLSYARPVRLTRDAAA